MRCSAEIGKEGELCCGSGLILALKSSHEAVEDDETATSYFRLYPSFCVTQEHSTCFGFHPHASCFLRRVTTYSSRLDLFVLEGNTHQCLRSHDGHRR